MAKKKLINKPVEKQVCYPAKCGFMLIGIIFIALGVWAYIDAYRLNLIVASALILLGVKKIFMAAKCC